MPLARTDEYRVPQLFDQTCFSLTRSNQDAVMKSFFLSISCVSRLSRCPWSALYTDSIRPPQSDPRVVYSRNIPGTVLERFRDSIGSDLAHGPWGAFPKISRLWTIVFQIPRVFLISVASSTVVRQHRTRYTPPVQARCSKLRTAPSCCRRGRTDLTPRFGDAVVPPPVYEPYLTSREEG